MSGFFDQTRRLSGNQSRTGFPDGDWNGHAARVAVWGGARGHRRIVVRAPGITRVVAPKLNADPGH